MIDKPTLGVILLHFLNIDTPTNAALIILMVEITGYSDLLYTISNITEAHKFPSSTIFCFPELIQILKESVSIVSDWDY